MCSIFTIHAPFSSLYCRLLNTSRLSTLSLSLKNWSLFKSKSHCDWRSVSKSWCRAHLGLMTRYLLLVDSYGFVFCGALSLTRGRVRLLYMLLAHASAVFLWSESLGTRGHILLSHIWDFHFRRLLRLAGSRWMYSTPPPHGLKPVIFVTVVRHIASATTTQKTQPLLLKRVYRTIAYQRSRHGPHREPVMWYVATSLVQWRIDCCLATSYKHSSYWVRLREMFIAPLPSCTRYSNILERCLLGRR
jgi:hypothetical protein